MRLLYARRGRFVRASRPPSDEMPKGKVIAVIDLQKGRARIADGVAASAEEQKEIDEAVQELKSSDHEKRAATVGYAEASRGAMKYYVDKATYLDKQLIGGTVRATFKAYRKTLPPKPAKPAKPDPEGVETAKPAVAPISPEVIAKAMYRALAENSKGKVKGEPGANKRTEIRGFWDLNEVAKKMLSQA